MTLILRSHHYRYWPGIIEKITDVLVIVMLSILSIDIRLSVSDYRYRNIGIGLMSKYRISVSDWKLNIGPTLLHWLPVDKRIIYKVLLITYKCLNGLAPEYLSDLLTLKPSRGLRSDNQNLLVEPMANMVTYGDHAYSVAGPRLWKTLPPHIRMSPDLSSFKSDIKTFLFRQAYE